AVMSYLLDGERPAYPSWRNYFDVIMVGGQKPGFFNQRRPFVQLDPDSGEADDGPVTAMTRDKIYQGGNISDFERMTGAKGEKVLYIGDHIYGDILRLKKTHVWRTAMVIQELEQESEIGGKMEQRVRDLTLLDRRRRNLESEIDYEVLLLKRLQRLLEDLANGGNSELRPQLEEAVKQSREALDSLRDRARLMREEVAALEHSIDRGYNRHWGTIFREGHENSRFGKQVSDYADLYTSRVSNFVSYSPLRYFLAPRRQMPHEQ
ncbi:MAG: 5'-nucleotidase domain-containing protein, partial [Myxococcota bacterium]